MKNDLSEDVGRFFNSNLEKISKNKLFADSPQRGLTMQSMQTSDMKGSFVYIKYFFVLLIFGFLCLVLWYYIHKYFPSWKIKINNFFKVQYSYLTSKIKTASAKGATGSSTGTTGSSTGATSSSSTGATGSSTGATSSSATSTNASTKTTSGSTSIKTSEKSNANLLTKAQMNNFHHTEKETSQPKPYTYENTIFDTSNNLNSNEILNYLLENNTESNVEEWCYIGESDEKRYCSISQGNKCMSGDVFPTKDLCVNPKLIMQN